MATPTTLEELVGYAHARATGLPIRTSISQAANGIFLTGGEVQLLGMMRQVLIPFYYEYCSPDLYSDGILRGATVELSVRVFEFDPDDADDGFMADLLRLPNGQVALKSQTEWNPCQRRRFEYDVERNAFIEPPASGSDFSRFFELWLQRTVVPRFLNSHGYPTFKEPVVVAEGSNVVKLDAAGEPALYSTVVVCRDRDALESLSRMGLEYGPEGRGVTSSGTVVFPTLDDMPIFIARLRCKDEQQLMDKVAAFPRR